MFAASHCGLAAVGVSATGLPFCRLLLHLLSSPPPPVLQADLNWSGCFFLRLHQRSQITCLKKTPLSTHHTLPIPRLLPISFVIFLWLKYFQVQGESLVYQKTKHLWRCFFGSLCPQATRMALFRHSDTERGGSDSGWACVTCGVLDACSCEDVTPSYVDVPGLPLPWCRVNVKWCSAACGVSCGALFPSIEVPENVTSTCHYPPQKRRAIWFGDDLSLRDEVKFAFCATALFHAASTCTVWKVIVESSAWSLLTS